MLLLLTMGCPAPDACDPEAPVDADGDGFDCAADCDDAAASVYPGATELCDAVDQDCDGAPLAEGVCGEAVEVSAVGEVLPSDSLGLFTIVGDVCGAPGPDYFFSDGGDLRILVDGTTAPDAITEALPMSPMFSAADGSGTVTNSSADIDGDGHEDLVFVDSFYLTGAHVLFGPFSSTGERAIHDADVRWDPYGVSAQGDWLTRWGFEDLDGVPGAEMFGAERGAEAVFSVWSVSSPGEPVLRILPPSDGARLIEDVQPVDDLDGDGVDEVIVYLTVGAGDEKVYQFQALAGGEIWAAGDGATTDGLALWTLNAEREDSIGVVEEAGAVLSVGDMNGDGLGDMLVAARHSERPEVGSGEDLVLSGAARGVVDLAEEVEQSFVSGLDCDFFGAFRSTGRSGGPQSSVADFDGDGRPDLYYDACGVDAIAPLRPDGLLTPLNGIRFTENATIGEVADLDQDGKDDLWIRDQDSGLDYIWRGWAIPWDEPQWW